MGGLDNADALCQGLANDAGLNATAPGIFKAILSTPSINAIDRLSTCSGGYFLVKMDGGADLSAKVANNKTDLFDGGILTNINRHEDGEFASSPVWTGTTPTGTASNVGNCNGWTSSFTSSMGAVGVTSQKNKEWVLIASSTCEKTASLYCAEQIE